ncbi:MAG TPA: transketolase C-terminal domain-containing protein [Candidatus Limnocylindria bacterium]|nr:transketolase C-terminal domain-containing protein [Candidatus Limnocylindria bacterium]
MPERTLKFAAAIAEALDGILAEDPSVLLIGARFVGITPSAAVMEPVTTKYADRIVWPPVAELAYCGIAIGAAMVGMRPIVELSTSTFSYEAIPQIVNEAPIIHANSGGRVNVPVTFHMLYGIRGAGAAQHSGSPQAWYYSAPGLQVVLPGSPADVKGLLRWSALRSRNPTVFLDHQGLMEIEGPVPEGPYEIPFGQADVKRAGEDVTVVATSIQVPRSLEAAELLAAEGISVEVVDPRTIEPLDRATILASVRKTKRAVVTDESPDRGGVVAGIAAIIAEECHGDLVAPVRRVAVPTVPVPYAESLERELVPSVERIADAVRSVVGRRTAASR